MTTFDAYQKKCLETAVYPNIYKNPAYVALGLGGEAGEVQEHIKKAIRDDGGIITDERRLKIAKELGDVLWYLAMLATECDLSLSDIAAGNTEKLARRKEENKLHGSGSDR